MVPAPTTFEDFTVLVKKKETVAAVLPMQEHWLPLSNLDLLLPPLDVGVFFCYKKQQNSYGFPAMASILKKSLAQALVSYYALAGEMVSSSVGEPELLCNNRGVDFYEAYADIELRHLQLYNVDASVEGKLVPKKKDGVLSVQATELKCGGIVVACTFSHQIADAHSANMFLVSWAEMAQSKSISIQPSFRRSLLNPRRPPASCDASITNLFVPISFIPPPPDKSKPSTDNQNIIISRIYYMTSESISKLQDRASSNTCKRTKFEALCACLWQIVATSEKDGTGKKCRIGVIVDGRRRLCNGTEPSSMSNYFGNVLSVPYGEEKVEELRTRPLSWVADAVHESVRIGACKEHFLNLIDWVEARRPEPAVAKVYCTRMEEGGAFVVSSGQRFPVTKVEFGWGRPVFGSYHFPWGGETGYVMPMPSASRQGDWVVYMHLAKRQLDLVEAELGHLFHPLTPDYFNLFGCI